LKQNGIATAVFREKTLPQGLKTHVMSPNKLAWPKMNASQEVVIRRIAN
jgi:hypothetical protein